MSHNPKALARQRAYRKRVGNAVTKRYEKTPNGFLMRTYRNMKSRITGVQKKKHHLYAGLSLLPKDKFYEWAKAELTFWQLWDAWIEADHKQSLTPSINRIEPSRGYEIGNMEWITHGENSRLGALSRIAKGRAWGLQPPRPFPKAVPKPPPFKPGEVLRAVVYGDTHVPFHDPAALNIVKSVVKDVKPHILIHNGDLVDCWSISRFDKDPTRRDTLQDNIDESRQHLAEMALLAPQAQRWLLCGNHETRLERLIASLDGAHRELPKLRIFQQSMIWPVLLELDAIGFQWVGEREQSKTPILPKIITKHGSVVRKWSAMTARGEWEKYGASGISGHSHRLGHFLHRDHNGTASWIETGCTCLLDPPYGTDFDWAQGCVVLTWNTDRRLMQAELVSIRDGKTLWRDKEANGDAG